MAERRPLTLVSGEHRELPAGDVVPVGILPPPDAAGRSALVVIRKAFVAGTPGTPDDVSIYSADSPALRIVDTVVYISTLIALATVTLRDATGGGGNALSDDIAAGTVGVKRNLLLTATGTVPTNGTLVLRRSDRGVAGEVIIYAQPQ